MLIRSFVSSGMLAGLLSLPFSGFARQEAAPPAPSSPIRISSGVMAGLLIKRVDPEFPADAPKGTVVLSVRVGTDGKVEEAKTVAGPGALREPAEAAVRQWLYKPYRLNGQPVEVLTPANLTSAP